MTLAPRTEVYIRLVCAQYKPEFVYPSLPITMPINETDIPLPPNSPVLARYISDRSVIVDMPSVRPTSNDSDVHVHIPRPSTQCTADPEVGRLVAGLNAAITLITGVLSLITTGYWATVSHLTLLL